MFKSHCRKKFICLKTWKDQTVQKIEVWILENAVWTFRYAMIQNTVFNEVKVTSKKYLTTNILS